MKSAVQAIFLALLTLAFTQAPTAQERGKSPMNVQEMTEVQPPNPKGGEPKPEDATKAILAAFDKYEVVGMTAAHGYKDLDDFILNLIRNPQLPAKINDIAVECGNSLYQPILDRYIAGDDMPLDEVRQVWRNTTQPMCSVSAFYEQLFPLVRRINQKLPPGKKLRMLAGDPPIDWAKVKSNEDFMQFMDRDVTITAVMKNEVLSKHRKALMLFGVGHLYHHSGDPLGFGSAVELYEKDYPGVTLVIAEHRGFGGETPFAKYNDEFESRMVSWPVPSLVQEMTGTWLADLLDKTYSSGNFFKIRPGGKPVPLQTKNKFSKMADAYLYLGPRDSLLKETHPAETFLNKEYMAELQRRAAIIGTGPITDQANPEKLSDRDYNPFVYDGMQQEMHFFGPNMLLPGAPPITGVPKTTTPSDPRP